MLHVGSRENHGHLHRQGSPLALMVPGAPTSEQGTRPRHGQAFVDVTDMGAGIAGAKTGG